MRAHLAHAAMVGMHSLCCGLPIAALMLSAVVGASTGLTALALKVAPLHRLLHAQEIWLVALSAALVSVGGYYEVRARKQGGHRGFPWLYALSCACFVFNLTIVAVHRA